MQITDRATSHFSDLLHNISVHKFNINKQEIKLKFRPTSRLKDKYWLRFVMRKKVYLINNLNRFEGNLKMPANRLNAASPDWSAEPGSNMRGFLLTTRGSIWLFHISRMMQLFARLAVRNQQFPA